MKKIFSFDAETDGLWGNPFAIAAIVYELHENFAYSHGKKIKIGEVKWVETARFMARLPDNVITDNWVRENVLPTLAGISPTHGIYETMLQDFAAFYSTHKQDADIICHMGYIVEAHLLREMHRLSLIGDWDAPYPLYDVSGNLQAADEDPTSVDGYAQKHGLKISDYGTTHNPLYDCEVAAKVYIHLNTK